MGSFSKAHGIDVTVHPSEDGCGNPCHPGHACTACEPFWQKLQATGHFAADVPSTFEGSAPIHKNNLGSRKIHYGLDAFRGKGGGKRT